VYARFDDEDVAADYRRLLQRGSVMRRLALAQHEPWQQAIRGRAGGDHLRVRTWSRAEMPATVWALLPDWSPTFEERARLARRLQWLRED
jgi:hypothetical protein